MPLRLKQAAERKLARIKETMLRMLSMRASNKCVPCSAHQHLRWSSYEPCYACKTQTALSAKKFPLNTKARLKWVWLCGI